MTDEERQSVVVTFKVSPEFLADMDEYVRKHYDSRSAFIRDAVGGLMAGDAP